MLLAAGLVLVAASFDMARPPEKQLSARAADTLIGAYQATVSPLLTRAGVRCRFQPTCSAYAREAIETHGLPRGFGMALRRVLRCHPLGPSGWDPVPPVKVDRP